MTRLEIAEMLGNIDLPIAYYSFENSVSPTNYPFLIYYYDGSDDKLADDTNYVKVETLRIELYSKQVDFDLETSVEELLNAYGIVYSKDRAYISQEHAWQTIYESEVIIDAE